MSHTFCRPLCVLAAAGLFAQCGIAHADFGLAVAVGRTDNIDRLEDGRAEETVTASVGGEIETRGAASDGRFRWEVGAVDYRDDAYDDEALAFVDANDRFTLFRRALFWNVTDRLGRQAMDPFTPATPDTRDYVNFFATGPELIVPIANDMALSARLNYSDVWYESQDVGNTRNGARVGLSFGSTPTRSFGVFADSESVEFDEADLYDGYDRQQVYLQYQTQRRRGTLRAVVGRSEIDRLGEVRDGSLFEGSWLRTISAFSQLDVNFRRGFSDAGELFQAEIGSSPDFGTVRDIAISAVPVQVSQFSARFSVQKPRIGGGIGVVWSRQEYEQEMPEAAREFPMWDARVSRMLTTRLRFEASAVYGRYELGDSGRRDSDRRLGVALGWSLPRRRSLNLNVMRVERSSDEPGIAYEENRVFVSFTHGLALTGITAQRDL